MFASCVVLSSRGVLFCFVEYEITKNDTVQPQLIQHKGYPSETHKVVTVDGYILELHRIPYQKGASVKYKGVAYLQHGLLSSSADWIITGPGNALGLSCIPSTFLAR